MVMGSSHATAVETIATIAGGIGGTTGPGPCHGPISRAKSSAVRITRCGRRPLGIAHHLREVRGPPLERIALLYEIVVSIVDPADAADDVPEHALADVGRD